MLNPTYKYSSKLNVVFTYKIAVSYVLYGFECENLFRIIRNNLFNFEFVWMRDLRGCALNWWGIIWLGLNWESAGSGAFILMKRYCGNACGDNPCKKGISYESRIVGLRHKRYCGNGLCKNCAVMQLTKRPAALLLLHFRSCSKWRVWRVKRKQGDRSCLLIRRKCLFFNKMGYNRTKKP